MIYNFTYITVQVGGHEARRHKRPVKVPEGTTFLQTWGTFFSWVYDKYPGYLHTVIKVTEYSGNGEYEVDFRALVPDNDPDYPKPPDNGYYMAIKPFLGYKPGDYPYVPCPVCHAPVTFHVGKRRTDNGHAYPVKGSCKYCYNSFTFEMV